MKRGEGAPETKITVASKDGLFQRKENSTRRLLIVHVADWPLRHGHATERAANKAGKHEKVSSDSDGRCEFLRANGPMLPSGGRLRGWRAACLPEGRPR